MLFCIVLFIYLFIITAFYLVGVLMWGLVGICYVIYVYILKWIK